jgi:hypothetical protein
LLRTELLLARITQQHDAAAIGDVVEAAMFFSTITGRLGAGFNCQLPCIFELELLQRVTHYWKEGVTKLRKTLYLSIGPSRGTTSDDEPIPVRWTTPARSQEVAVPPTTGALWSQ